MSSSNQKFNKLNELIDAIDKSIKKNFFNEGIFLFKTENAVDRLINNAKLGDPIALIDLGGLYIRHRALKASIASERSGSTVQKYNVVNAQTLASESLAESLKYISPLFEAAKKSQNPYVLAHLSQVYFSGFAGDIRPHFRYTDLDDGVTYPHVIYNYKSAVNNIQEGYSLLRKAIELGLSKDEITNAVCLITRAYHLIQQAKGINDEYKLMLTYYAVMIYESTNAKSIEQLKQLKNFDFNSIGELAEEFENMAVRQPKTLMNLLEKNPQDYFIIARLLPDLPGLINERKKQHSADLTELRKEMAEYTLIEKALTRVIRTLGTMKNFNSLFDSPASAAAAAAAPASAASSSSSLSSSSASSSAGLLELYLSTYLSAIESATQVKKFLILYSLFVNSNVEMKDKLRTAAGFTSNSEFVNALITHIQRKSAAEGSPLAKTDLDRIATDINTEINEQIKNRNLVRQPNSERREIQPSAPPQPNLEEQIAYYPPVLPQPSAPPYPGEGASSAHIAVPAEGEVQEGVQEGHAQADEIQLEGIPAQGINLNNAAGPYEEEGREEEVQPGLEQVIQQMPNVPSHVPGSLGLFNSPPVRNLNNNNEGEHNHNEGEQDHSAPKKGQNPLLS